MDHVEKGQQGEIIKLPHIIYITLPGNAKKTREQIRKIKQGCYTDDMDYRPVSSVFQ